MLATTTCPSKKELREYLVGQLSDSESSLIEKHLQDCRCCEEVVNHLDSPAIAKDEPDVLLNVLPQVRRLERNREDNVQDPASDSNLDEKSEEKLGEKPGENCGENLEAPPAEDSWREIANRKLSSYELVQRIGSGGMGMVYRARHRSLDKWVAVKLLPARRSADGEAIGRFQREMRLVGRLNHPAIVSATDAGLDGDTHFLVMELIDGLDLSRIVRAVGTITPADAAEIGRQVALGLDHAHAQGVIHRDIKPSNLMLDGQGQVKLLDLGLADLCPWCQPVDDWTTVGQLLGTLDYMAPEQADAQRGVTHRSDLYSLGATLFRLVAGRPPLAPTPDGSPLEKLRLLATERPPAVRTLRPDLPAEFARIIDLLLDRNPARRPTSAAAVAELLEPLTPSADLRSLIDTARRNLRDQADELKEAELDRQPGLPDWPPNVPLAGPEPVAASPGTESSGWIRGGWRVLATLLAAAGGAVVLGTILIVLETMQGQLVIETDQADLRVRVVSEGEPVRHLELQPGANATRLRADKYEILIDQPVDRTVMIENGSFELRRGETVIARIRSQPRGEAVARSAATDPVSPGPREVVYEGRTTDEWIDELRHERSAAKIQEAMEALISLQPQDSQEEIVELVLDAVRRHGSRSVPTTIYEYSPQLLALVSSPPELIERLLRDMAADQVAQADHYMPLILELLPKVHSDDDLIQVSNRLLEVLPALARQQSFTVVSLGSRLAERLTPKHEELADQVLRATFENYRDYDGLLFGVFPKTDRERDALPAVRRRYVIADNLRFALETSRDVGPSVWIPLFELVVREPENIVHLENLIPNLRRRLLSHFGETVTSPNQRSAWIIDQRMLRNGLFTWEEYANELTRLSIAGSGSEIDLGSGPRRLNLNAFHYLLTKLVRLGKADEEVLEWLLKRQGELKESHDRAIDLASIMAEYRDALFNKAPQIPGADGKLRIGGPFVGGFFYKGAPLSYVPISSSTNFWELVFETDQRGQFPNQSVFMAWLNEIGIEPLDPEIANSFRESLIGYWDYILITGAIELLTNGEAAETSEREASERDLAAPTPPPSPLPSEASDSVYEGRTARQWMDEIRRERSVAKIQEGMTALLALQPKGVEEEIVDLVLDVMRRHGMPALSQRSDETRRSLPGATRSLTIVEELVSSVTSPGELSQRLLRDMAEPTESNVERYAELVEALVRTPGRFMTPEDLEALAEKYLEVLPDLSQPPPLVASLAQKLAESLVASHEPLATNLLDSTLQRFREHHELLFGLLPHIRRQGQGRGGYLPARAAYETLPQVVRRYMIADHFRRAVELPSNSPADSMELLLNLDYLEEHPGEAELIRTLVPELPVQLVDRAFGIMDFQEGDRQSAILQSLVRQEWQRGRQGEELRSLEPLAELAGDSGLEVEFGSTSWPQHPNMIPMSYLLRHRALLIAQKVGRGDEQLVSWLRNNQEETKAAYDGYIEFMEVVVAWEEKLAAISPNSDSPPRDELAVKRSLGQYTRLLDPDLFRQQSQPRPEVAARHEETGIEPIAPELWKAAGENLPGYWDHILITGAIQRLTSDQ
jgi:serine/threonine protein kinase